MVLSNDVAALVGFACEAALWGAYVILFLVSAFLLLRRLWRTRSMNVPIFIANCVLFASCTAHFAIEFSHFYMTLNTTGVDHYADETMSLVGADTLISFCDLLGELVLLYRCWVIWGKNYWVVFPPLLTAIGGFSCMMEVAHLLITLDPTAPVPPAALVPLGIAGYALPLATNASVTALIVGRLWFTARGAEKRAGTELRMTGTVRAAQRAVAIIVESGLLYLVTQLVFVVLFALGHPAEAILAVIAVQIYGIAPTLIVIRVALGIPSDLTVKHDNSSVDRLTFEEHGAQLPRPAFLSGIQSVSSTEESGRTLQQECDGEFFEMKTVDFDLDHAIAV